VVRYSFIVRDSHPLSRVGYPTLPVNSSPLRELKRLEPEELRAIEHFFESYNRFQGRAFRISGREGRASAEAALARAERLFRRARS
jgi:inorganic pyrophosphatase